MGRLKGGSTLSHPVSPYLLICRVDWSLCLSFSSTRNTGDLAALVMAGKAEGYPEEMKTQGSLAGERAAPLSFCLATELCPE